MYSSVLFAGRTSRLSRLEKSLVYIFFVFIRLLIGTCTVFDQVDILNSDRKLCDHILIGRDFVKA